MSKKKKPSKKDLAQLWCSVENEGFGYYMLQYGPDLDLIERMGFDRKELEAAIKLMSAVEEAIDDCEQYVEEN